MKNLFFLFFIFILFSCDDTVDDNQYLPNVPVSITIDLNLPEGQQLLIDRYKIFTQKGVKGVYLKVISNTNFLAFDLACPHITLQDCSTMSISGDSLYMVCPCDSKRFQVLDGAPENGGINPARQYNVTVSGSILRITS